MTSEETTVAEVFGRASRVTCLVCKYDLYERYERADDGRVVYLHDFSNNCVNEGKCFAYPMIFLEELK